MISILSTVMIDKILLYVQVLSLHYAARHNMLDIMRVLVEHGADVDISGNDGLTPLHYAARFKINPLSGSKEKGGLVTTYLIQEHVKQVLEFGRYSHDKIEMKNDNLDDKDEFKNYDKKASDPLIEYLVKVGASINKKDKYGLTPLHYACMRGKKNVKNGSISIFRFQAMLKLLRSW